MFCLACRKVFSDPRLEDCPSCASPLYEVNQENLDRLLNEVRRERSSVPLLAAFAVTAVAVREEEAVVAEQSAQEQRRARQEEQAALEQQRLAAYVAYEQQRLERRAQRKQRAASRLAEGSDSGAPALPEGLDTGAADLVASLDSSPHEPARDQSFGSVLYENIGWFIGALLVLSGSVYGVREAWLAFGEVGRYTTVGSAFFVYHSMFVALSALLASRARTAAAVVAGIGIGLLPIVAAVFANLLAVSPSLGSTVAAAFVAASALTSFWGGRRLAPERPWLLPLVVVPALVSELPLETLSEGSPVRAWLPLLALAGPIIVGRLSPAKLRLDPLVIALYCAVAVQIFALVSGRDEVGDVAFRTGGARYTSSLALYFAAIGAVMMDLGSQRRWHSVAPRLFSVLSYVGLSTALLATLRVLGVMLDDLGSPVSRQDALVGVATATLSALCAISLRRSLVAAEYAVWFSSTVAAFCLARGLGVQPELRAWWFVAAAIPSLGFVAASGRLGLARLSGTVLWILLAAALSQGNERWHIGLLIAVGYALAAHLRGRSAPTWHYSAAWMLGLVWLWVFGRPVDGTPSAMLPLFGGGLFLYIAYGVASHFTEVRDRRLRPLADTALLFAFALLFVLLPRVTDTAAAGSPMLQALVVLALLAVFARGVLDHSAAPSLLALLLADGLLMQLWQVGEGQTLSRFLGFSSVCLAIGAAVSSVSLHRDEVAVPRHLFSFIPLPLPARGRTVVVDSLAVASLVTGFLALLSSVTFLSSVNEVDRPHALFGSGAVLVVLLIGFLTTSHERFSFRAREATLWAAAAVVAFVAVVNRIGRPLPPRVVGRNLTLILVAVWVVAVALHRYGPKLAEWLGKKAEGYRYHRVPHAGVIALGALLLFDALSIGGPTLLRFLVVTPPTFLLGPAIAAFLLSRSLRLPALVIVPFILLVPFCGLVVSERSVLGPELVSLMPPGGQWVPMSSAGSGGDIDWLASWRYDGGNERAVYQAFELGCVWAVCAIVALSLVLRFRPELSLLILSVLLPGHEKNEGVRSLAISSLQILSVAALLLLILAAGVVSSPLVALFGAAASVALVVRPIMRPFYALASLVLPWIIHSLAQRQAKIPSLVGPALMLGAAGLIAIAAWRTAELKRGRRRLAIGLSSLSAVLWLGPALLYALSFSSPVSSLFELGGVLDGAFNSSVRFFEHGNVTWTLAAATCAAMVSARSYSRTGDILAAVPTFSALTLFGLSLFFAQLWWRGGSLMLDGATGAMFLWSAALSSLAIAVVVATLVRVGTEASRNELAAGAKYARDVMLVGVLVVASFGAMAFKPSPDAVAAGPWPSFALWPSLVSVSVCSVIALVTALRRLTPFHMYVAQSSLVVSYGVVRAGLAQSLRAEHDALFLLVLGFVLVGALVAARRAKVPPLSASIRYFISGLPILMVLVVPFEASVARAGLAAGTGLLYAAVGWVEDNRVFGAMGAVAANVALLVFALSQGLDGIEVYFVPLGLVCLICVHLFADELDASVRQSLRFIGSAFVYAPSALAIAAEAGSARDAMYPLAFAGACFIGIALGMLFHIRAYLFMGTVFITLDVLVNLVRVSLRDQRVGFFVLSASGLAILGGMVWFTLNKQKVEGWVRTLRRTLRAWD